MMSSLQEERIVMTPLKKTARSTTLMMERKWVPMDSCSGAHVAGGANSGIIVNKQKMEGLDKTEDCHVSLEFRVFLINASTKLYTQEKRIISYWFKSELQESKRTGVAQDFFKQLVSPADFPRDYVGFIKKIMKLMQSQYPTLQKVQVQMTQEKEMEHLPNQSIIEQEAKEELKSDSVLKMIEESYPNSLTINDMSRRLKSETDIIRNLVLDLITQQLIKPVGAGVQGGEVDSGASAFRRVHQNEDQVTVVKQMPRGRERSVNPTIAIITSQYHEKMAVDAMMSNKQTFMRYATVGEANVYTLGDIGCHRVVSTKLPMIGNGRDALIATGSTTTRLLGTFQGVESVFLVGVGGAVPHYTDFKKHVRLGDVVISCPVPHSSDKKFIFEYCENVFSKNDDSVTFESRSWCPPNLGLQDISQHLYDEWTLNPNEADWKVNFAKAVRELGDDWIRPDVETDKLYMSVGGNDLIEVGHPVPSDGTMDPRTRGEPVIHLGPIAAGRQVALHDQFRQAFASRHGILAYDAELDSVVESIYGNRKDQYVLIRGMSDYRDGSSSENKEWKQYSALMAASVLKSIIDRMDPP